MVKPPNGELENSGLPARGSGPDGGFRWRHPSRTRGKKAVFRDS